MNYFPDYDFSSKKAPADGHAGVNEPPSDEPFGTGGGLESIQANYVRRFVSRIFDTSWEILLLYGLLIGSTFVLPKWVAMDFFFGIIDGMIHGGLVFVSLVLFPALLVLAMLLDAGVYAIFGNTPGKALMGLHVVNNDGTSPGFLKYWARNLMMLLFGLLMGVYALAPLSSLMQAFYVIAKGRTTYDFQMRTAVYDSESGGWAQAALYLFMAIFFGAGCFLPGFAGGYFITVGCGFSFTLYWGWNVVTSKYGSPLGMR